MINRPVRQFRFVFISCFVYLLYLIPVFSQIPESVSGGEAWSQGADMLSARGFHAVTAVDGRIFAFGGFTNKISTSTEEYDPVADKWLERASMPIARRDFSGCSINEKIYAIGGWFGLFTLSAVHEYDPDTDTWTEKAPLPEARWGHTTCSVNGKIYVIGGVKCDLEEFYEAVEVYDPVTDTWTSKASIPTPRWFLSCGVVNGKIYAIGGVSEQGAVSIVEEYDPENDTWKTKSSMSVARWGLATATVNGKIYAIGGGDEYPPVLALESVEQYDPVMDTWSNKPPIPEGRIGFAACSLNEKIYVPGGSILLPNDANAELYIYDTGSITGTDKNNFKVYNFRLHQNYPNPFSSSTRIAFDIQKNCHVKLQVCDAMGREISTLVNQNMNEGHHKVQFNGKGLNPGTYFYRIEMGDYIETRIMLLSGNP